MVDALHDALGAGAIVDEARDDALTRAAEEDGAVLIVGDRAGELIREQMNGRRCLAARALEPSGNEDAAVFLALLAEARHPVADAESVTAQRADRDVGRENR